MHVPRAGCTNKCSSQNSDAHRSHTQNSTTQQARTLRWLQDTASNINIHSLHSLDDLLLQPTALAQLILCTPPQTQC